MKRNYIYPKSDDTEGPVHIKSKQIKLMTNISVSLCLHLTVKITASCVRGHGSDLNQYTGLLVKYFCFTHLTSVS